MASKTSDPNRKSFSADEITRMVSEQLPGFKPSKAAPSLADAAARDAVKSVRPGVSVDELRRKFFGDDSADAGDASELFDSAPRVGSVMVEPIDGGPAKTADIAPDGSVKIVQG
jgi:hypothetical protein